MIDPTWPERIVFGQAERAFRQYRKTGLTKAGPPQGLWPGLRSPFPGSNG